MVEINNMGKLRKIGRKVKKGIKKLFSSDIGRFVGMVGMFMAMSWAGKAMKGFFKGAETVATEAAAAATEGAAVATEAVTSEAISATTGESLVGAGGGFGTQSGTLATGGGGSGTIMTEANTAVNQINSAAVNPSINANATIDNTITGSLDKSVEAGVFDQPASEVSKNVVDIDTTTLVDSKDMIGSDMLAENKLVPEANFTEGMSQDVTKLKEVSGDSVNPNVKDLEIGSGKIKQMARNTGQNIKNYFTDGSIVPDTITGVSTGVIMSKLQDDPEMGGGFISPPPMQEMAQGAYMQEIAPVVANVTGVPNFKSFSDMAQQTIYGVGTPNHLAGLYATPPAPTVNYG
tara:strand:+ start:714 stop:1754 length:1041 start_codon:yes stop_codon:yes gene_type:complete